MSQPKDDDEIEEEIEENLSLEEGNDSDLSLSNASKPFSDSNVRKRKLFDFDYIDDDNAGAAGTIVKSKFDFDDDRLDDLLSGDNLAIHFKAEEESSIKEENYSNVPEDDNESSEKIDDDVLPIEMEDEIMEVEIDEESRKDENREINPDIMLLNDPRRSINSLKNLHVSQENSLNNQSTTNDISDIVKDDVTNTSTSHGLRKVRSFETSDKSHHFDERYAKSLENLDLHDNNVRSQESKNVDEVHENEVSNKDDDDDEFEIEQNDEDDITPQNSEHVSLELSEVESAVIEEIVSEKSKDSSQTNVNIQNDMSSKHDEVILSNKNNSNIESEHSNNISNCGDSGSLNQINNIDDGAAVGKLTVNSGQDSLQKSLSEHDVSDNIHLLVEKSSITNTIEDKPKPFEKLEHSKEILEDIAEESERELESFDYFHNERQVVDITDMQKLNAESIQTAIAKGQEYRNILEHHINSNYEDMSPNDIPVEIPMLSDEHSNLQGGSEFDSVVSLNMLQMLEIKVKELQEIIAGKDICLAALNMQLEANSRRDSLKEKDSLKELPSSGRASSSLATLSTEYKTLHDEYASRVSL